VYIFFHISYFSVGFLLVEDIGGIDSTTHSILPTTYISSALFDRKQGSHFDIGTSNLYHVIRRDKLSSFAHRQGAHLLVLFFDPNQEAIENDDIKEVGSFAQLQQLLSILFRHIASSLSTVKRLRLGQLSVPSDLQTIILKHLETQRERESRAI
jgi:hypothetical protein